MKANELMIGDWVLCDNNAVRIVDMISEKDDIASIENADVYGTFFVSQAQPIPITKEILIKNGFESVEHGLGIPEYCYYQLLDDAYTTIDVTVKENYSNPDYNWSLEIHSPNVFSGRGFINNVHDLQHALKICGIEKEIKL